MKVLKKSTFLFCVGFLATVAEVSAQSVDAEISLRKTEVTATSRCYDIRLKNVRMEKLPLNVFGSFVLSDSDGAMAQFDLMGTSSRNPTFPVNETMMKGDVVAGWLCWTAPSANWKAVNLDIKAMFGPRVARLKL